MRPEGWALGGLYALWMFPACGWPRRIRLLAMACVAPLLWAAMDWYVTGDPLHSLHGTADLAEAVDRRREPEQAPFWTLQYFGFVLREPVVIGLAVGLVFAWRFRLRAAILPLAVVGVMVAVFMIGPFFGLPLIGRYVRTPSVLLALFYGLAVAGWLMLDPGRRRQVWMWVGIGVAGSRSPSCPGTCACSATSSARWTSARASTTGCRPWRSPRASAGSWSAAAARSAPPTTASCPTCAGGSTCRRMRSPRWRPGSAPSSPSSSCRATPARRAGSSAAGSRGRRPDDVRRGGRRHDLVRPRRPGLRAVAALVASTRTPSPTTFESARRSFRRSEVASKALLPVPRITGNTIRLI